MSETPMKGFWRGRPLEDLTKEELIEAIFVMDRLLKEEQKLHQQTMSLFVR